MRRADLIAGAVLLALAVAFSAAALRYYAYWGPNGPGPAFLPFWLGLVMALLALMLLVGAVRAGHRHSAVEAGPAGDGAGVGEAVLPDVDGGMLPRGEGLRRLGIVLGLTLALVVLLQVLGMVLATVLFLLAMMRLADRQPWPLALAVALATAGLNFLVFTYWLKVPMPTGLLGF